MHGIVLSVLQYIPQEYNIHFTFASVIVDDISVHFTVSHLATYILLSGPSVVYYYYYNITNFTANLHGSGG